jgi:hypothetical protein
MRPDDLPSVFAEGWVLPKPDRFLDFFRPLIHPDAIFSQPIVRDARGRDDIEQMFRQLFALLPDLVAEPVQSASLEDTVFIEFEYVGLLGPRTFRFAVCDRFVLEKGMIVSRRSFFNSASVALMVLRHPQSWPRLIRSALV